MDRGAQREEEDEPHPLDDNRVVVAGALPSKPEVEPLLVGLARPLELERSVRNGVAVCERSERKRWGRAIRERRELAS